MKNFYIKPEIVYGENSLDKICSLDFDKVFITTDQVMIDIGLVKHLTNKLEAHNIDYVVFSDVLPNPTTDIVEDGLFKFIRYKPDCIIALGGGSVIDTTKAIIYYCVKIKENFMNNEFVHKPFFVAIPTTSGTGSEVTEYSVLTDSKSHVKMPITDKIMLPDIAILDPVFTKSVPAFVTAETGIDALTHAIEAYVSKDSNHFTDSLAIESIKMIFDNLRIAYHDGSNMKARENLHLASAMAGIAFNGAGLGINHSLAHVFGAEFNISHGKSNGIMLPYVIEFNMADVSATRKYSHIAKSINLDFGEDKKNAYALIEAIKILERDLGLEYKLSLLSNFSIDIFKNKIEEMSKTAMGDICTASNPYKVSQDDLQNILDKMSTF